jgi:hypothetical protein
MLLLKYFSFSGSALLLLLLALNSLLIDAKEESVHADTARPVIRIRSIEKLPEKVDFDTNLPTIVPLPATIVINPPVLRSSFAFVQITPGPLPSFSSVTSVVRTAEAVGTPHVTKQIGRRANKPLTNATNERPAPAASEIQLSLIDDMRSRFEQSVFKVN